MKKYLLYVMQGEPMCVIHALLNGLDMKERGIEAKIIFEGASVKIPVTFDKENNPVYKQTLEAGLIAGVCLACSKMMGVKEDIEKLGLPLLSDMKNHAGMSLFIEKGYEVVVF